MGGMGIKGYDQIPCAHRFYYSKINPVLSYHPSGEHHKSLYGTSGFDIGEHKPQSAGNLDILFEDKGVSILIEL